MIDWKLCNLSPKPVYKGTVIWETSPFKKSWKDMVFRILLFRKNYILSRWVNVVNNYLVIAWYVVECGNEWRRNRRACSWEIPWASCQILKIADCACAGNGAIAPNACRYGIVFWPRGKMTPQSKYYLVFCPGGQYPIIVFGPPLYYFNPPTHNNT